MLQTDVGNQGGRGWSRQMSENTTLAPQGWISVHELVGTSHVTSLDQVHVLSFNLYGENPGPGAGYTGAFEVYLALPYIMNVVSKADSHVYETSPAWEDS